MSLLLCFLLIVAVGGFIALPLLRPSGSLTAAAEVTGGGGELWLREKATALTAIREAEFDRATGKLSEEDYTSLRGMYEHRALKAMEHLGPEAPTGAAAEPGGESGTAATGAAGPVAAFCTSCGNAFGESDRFCGGCGAARV